MSNEQNNLLSQGLIHVNEYTRTDGVQVDEHWRERSGNAKMTMPANSGIVADTPDFDPEEEENKRKEVAKALADGIRTTISAAISLIPNVGLKNTLTAINNIGAGLQKENYEDVIVDGPTDTDTAGPVMYLKNSFDQYSTKIDELNKQTISKDSLNTVMGTATNALVQESSTLSKIVETQDPKQKQSIVDAAQKAIRSLLGLASNAKEKVVNIINSGTQTSEEKNTSMKTYESLTELEGATYRYENLLGAGLFGDAESEANKLFELSQTFFQNVSY